MSLPEQTQQPLSFRKKQSNDYRFFGRILSTDLLLAFIGSHGNIAHLQVPFIEIPVTQHTEIDIPIIIGNALLQTIMIAGGICGIGGMLKTAANEIPTALQRRTAKTNNH